MAIISAEQVKRVNLIKPTSIKIDLETIAIDDYVEFTESLMNTFMLPEFNYKVNKKHELWSRDIDNNI